MGKARECRVESDCAAIQNTTCTSDPRDTKTLRCLCGDYTAPVNGLCANKYKGTEILVVKKIFFFSKGHGKK